MEMANAQSATQTIRGKDQVNSKLPDALTSEAPDPAFRTSGGGQVKKGAYERMTLVVLVGLCVLLVSAIGWVIGANRVISENYNPERLELLSFFSIWFILTSLIVLRRSPQSILWSSLFTILLLSSLFIGVNKKIPLHFEEYLYVARVLSHSDQFFTLIKTIISVACVTSQILLFLKLAKIIKSRLSVLQFFLVSSVGVSGLIWSGAGMSIDDWWTVALASTSVASVIVFLEQRKILLRLASTIAVIGLAVLACANVTAIFFPAFWLPVLTAMLLRAEEICDCSRFAKLFSYSLLALAWSLPLALASFMDPAVLLLSGENAPSVTRYANWCSRNMSRDMIYPNGQVKSSSASLPDLNATITRSIDLDKYLRLVDDCMIERGMVNIDHWGADSSFEEQLEWASHGVSFDVFVPADRLMDAATIQRAGGGSHLVVVVDSRIEAMPMPYIVGFDNCTFTESGFESLRGHRCVFYRATFENVRSMLTRALTVQIDSPERFEDSELSELLGYPNFLLKDRSRVDSLKSDVLKSKAKSVVTPQLTTNSKGVVLGLEVGPEFGRVGAGVSQTSSRFNADDLSQLLDRGDNECFRWLGLQAEPQGILGMEITKKSFPALRALSLTVEGIDGQRLLRFFMQQPQIDTIVLSGKSEICIAEIAAYKKPFKIGLFITDHAFCDFPRDLEFVSGTELVLLFDKPKEFEHAEIRLSKTRNWQAYNATFEFWDTIRSWKNISKIEAIVVEPLDKYTPIGSCCFPMEFWFVNARERLNPRVVNIAQMFQTTKSEQIVEDVEPKQVAEIVEWVRNTVDFYEATE